MRNKLLNLADHLGVGITYTKELPPNWWAAFNSMEAQVEINWYARDAKDMDYILLHELCHALQFRTDSEIWITWTEELEAALRAGRSVDDPLPSCGLLELDAEQRALGWLYLNGYNTEKYVEFANRNLDCYGLEL